MNRPVRRRALLLGVENYADTRFAPLPSIRADLSLLGQVLLHRHIGAFTEVRPVMDCTAERMCTEIVEFLGTCDEDELALVYISGHGTRLVQVNSEFHFVTTDTDFDNVAATAVGAQFVNDALESCPAPQKVLMIDCCQSGGFAVGLRAADRDDSATAKGVTTPAPSPVLRSNGVFVLSSSRATEASFSGSPESTVITPSLFTGAVVETLRSGDAARPETGEVTVDDLFEYVNQRLRVDAKQVPVKSAVQVDDRIVIASRPQGPATLTPVPRDADTGAVPEVVPAKDSRPSWPRLLDYYRRCLTTGRSEFSVLSVAEHGESYVCVRGSESFLSGTVEEDHRVPVPDEAREFVEDVIAADDELWAGYPAVVLQSSQNSRNGARHRFAPLLLRKVEVVHTAGGTRLEPTGRIIAHPELIEIFLGKDTAADFNAAYRPTWHARQPAAMANDIGKLLEFDLGLACVEPLRPGQLAECIDVDTPNAGARNAAVLCRVPNGPSPVSKLLEDLDSLVEQVHRIRDTALSALDPETPHHSAAQATPFQLVTPLQCNEAQETVIRSAMRNRLTVATGPPGTGKSQLVTNLVATAVANNSTVLVASTNNRAVDEVWKRCESVAPGSLVRTGSLEYRSGTSEALRGLLALRPTDGNPATAMAALRQAEHTHSAQRDLLATTGELEQRLLIAGRTRDDSAEKLGVSIVDLLSRLEQKPLEIALRAAEGAVRARFFARYRRARLLRRWEIPVEDDDVLAGRCATLAQFLAAEKDWRTARARLEALPDDNELSRRLHTAESELRHTSAVALGTSTRTAALQGRSRITDLIEATEDGRAWRAVRAALPNVRGWAVSTLSARYFPPAPALFDLVVIDEASQCAIPAILPLLFRARRAVIIGDPMQLPHIAEIGPEQEIHAAQEAGFGLGWLEAGRMSYRRHSAFRACERAAGGHLLLDEHFRCHPKIAGLVNGLFYDGQLAVLTDTRGRPTIANRDAIHWTHIEGNAEQPRSGKSWFNRAEAAKVVEAIKFLLPPGGATADQPSVGVVTPFKAQVDMIRSQLGQGFEHVRIGTVHTFQGGECDFVLYSLVAAPNMPRGSIKWVERQLNLWNVAITRARSHLIVVGNRGLWSERWIGAALLNAAVGVQEDSGASSAPDELQDRLSAFLAGAGGRVTLQREVRGHLTDAVVEDSGGVETAVILDRGVHEGVDPARHLRLMLRHRGIRADPEQPMSAVRIPAWMLYRSGR
ncbi:caspase, EACC1-associated type [Nocardia rhamnosiphila]